MSRSVFITGGTGFFGVHAAVYYAAQGWTVYLGTRFPARYSCSPLVDLVHRFPLEDLEGMLQVLRELRPTFLIHAAGYTEPLRAEREQVRAWEINVQGTRNVFAVCATLSIPFVFLSTDLVFDGERKWYAETDEPRPVIWYGKTKLQAEKVLLQQHLFHQWVILRSSLLFGFSLPWKLGFPGFAIEKLRNREPAQLFKDQYRTPLYAFDLARAVLAILEKNLWCQIFHAGGPERINRVDFVHRFCHIAQIPTDSLNACRMKDVPEYTTRVRDVSLDSSKLCESTGWKQTPLDEAFRQMCTMPPLLQQLQQHTASMG